MSFRLLFRISLDTTGLLEILCIVDFTFFSNLLSLGLLFVFPLSVILIGIKSPLSIGITVSELPSLLPSSITTSSSTLSNTKSFALGFSLANSSSIAARALYSCFKSSST
uniref:Uncharacterized protein n=1 Tax=Cacopsylla melanoneura TaxID=428564 RepID=A0A8D9ELH8_9HEMI